MPRWSRLILPCTALGDTPLQISWFQDGRQLSDWLNLNPSKLGEQIQQPWIQHPPMKQPLPGSPDESGLIQVLTNGSLSIGRLSDSGGGNYTCQARNRHGQDHVDYVLTVLTPPPAPQLHFAASNWSSVTLQWASDGGGDISDKTNRTRVSPTRCFFVKFRPRGADGNQPPWIEKSIPAGWRSVPIGDLNCGTEYEFMLVASSKVGNSSFSNLVTAKTKGSPPEYVPADDSDLTLTSTSCTVDLNRWQDRGCPIQQYVFRFRASDANEWIIAGAESPPQQNFLLGGLLPAREYAIRVTTINAAGSVQRDYLVRTPPLIDSGSADTSVGNSLAPLFSDLRVAVPMAVSSLAILLTVVTLLLRYRYRSGDYIRPDQPQPVGNSVRTYADDSGTPDEGNSTLSVGRKRPPPPHCDYGDDQVSPYAVFPSLLATSGKSQFSSSRRMKTFVVDGTKDTLPLEMSNYAPAPMRPGMQEEPTYDYIAPITTEQRSNSNSVAGPGRNNTKLPNSSQSVFVPIIPARSTWNQQYRAQQHYHADWNNQETLVLSQRL